MANLSNILGNKIDISFFSELYANTPLGYQSLNTTGHIIEVNPSWCTILGYSREEVIGKWFGDFLIPEQRDLFKERFSRFKEVGIAHVEFYMIRKDNSQIIVEFDGKIGYDVHGNFKQTHCVLKDVTSTRLFEEKYKQLFMEMTAGFGLHEMIFDAEGKPVDYTFLELNPAFEKYTGLKNSEVLGRSVKSVLPNLEPYWIENFGKVVLTGKPFDFENYSKDLGKYYEVHAFKSGPKHFAAILVDITARKLVEKEILEKNQQLERFNKFAVDREHKMIELKNRIKELEQQHTRS